MPKLGSTSDSGVLPPVEDERTNTSPYARRTSGWSGLPLAAVVPAARLAVYGAVLGALLAWRGLLTALGAVAAMVAVELVLGWLHRARLRAWERGQPRPGQA